MRNQVPRLLKRARASAGLSQRELARKAGTAQSVVARIELSETSPSWDTLIRLINAAGFTVRVALDRLPTLDRSILDDVPRILSMTPEQRLQELADIDRFVAGARRV